MRLETEVDRVSDAALIGFTNTTHAPILGPWLGEIQSDIQVA